MCLFCVCRAKNGTEYVGQRATWPKTWPHFSLLSFCLKWETEIMSAAFSILCFHYYPWLNPEQWYHRKCVTWRPRRWGYPVSTRHHWKLWIEGIISCGRTGQWIRVSADVRACLILDVVSFMLKYTVKLRSRWAGHVEHKGDKTVACR